MSDEILLLLRVDCGWVHSQVRSINLRFFITFTTFNNSFFSILGNGFMIINDIITIY